MIRLVQIAQGSSGVSFTYDNDGRCTTLTLPNGVTMSYAYDAASQLTGIGYGSLGNLTYAYDLAGRRTTVGGSFARSNVPAALTNASYNANNQLTRFGSQSMTYDASGNLTSDGVNTYTWDARDHLVSISGGASANFQYDAFGRRVSKTIGATTAYLYDGINPVQELSGGTLAANLLTGGTDEYFTRTDSSGTANLLTDALGSAVALTNSSGSTIASYTYEPFGNTTANGSPTNPYQYTGRENDGTGLYFYRARYYSPTSQRFISEDPAGLAGSGVNLYAYAFNSPTNLTDPSGEDAGTALRCALFFAVMPYGCDIFSILQPAPPKTSGRKSPYHKCFGGDAICNASGHIVQDGLGGAQPVLGPYILLAPVGGGVAGGFEAAAADDSLVTVIHFTDPTTAQVIEQSGAINQLSYVTLPSQIPAGASASDVESLLELRQGAGQMSYTFQVPQSPLLVPEDGATTSGGALQFRLANPVPVGPGSFVPTH